MPGNVWLWTRVQRAACRAPRQEQSPPLCGRARRFFARYRQGGYHRTTSWASIVIGVTGDLGHAAARQVAHVYFARLAFGAGGVSHIFPSGEKAGSPSSAMAGDERTAAFHGPVRPAIAAMPRLQIRDNDNRRGSNEDGLADVCVFKWGVARSNGNGLSSRTPVSHQMGKSFGQFRQLGFGVFVSVDPVARGES